MTAEESKSSGGGSTRYKLSEAMAAFVVRMDAVAQSIQKSFATPEVQNALGLMVKLFGPSEKVSASGWLPHHTTPFDRLEDVDDIAAFLDAYYRTEWETVRRQLESAVVGYDLDDEFKSAFSQALRCHERGDYLLVVRHVFPEIETLARMHFEPDRRQVVSIDRPLRDVIGKLLPRDIAKEPYLFEFMKQARNVVFTHAREPDVLEKLSRIAIPNRHACLHGHIRYDTHANSINALLLLENSFFVAGDRNFLRLS